MTGEPFSFTLVIPYYDQPAMLRRQDEEWRGYPDAVRVVVVDDGSPEHPADAVLPADSVAEVYRIGVDIPWNRNGARNLGAKVAKTPWILHTDIDHVLPVESSVELASTEGRTLDSTAWYRLRRFRVGRADETRRKDALPEDCTFGEIKPHVDSFLTTTELYWRAGGYDEDFSGSLGGSSLFLFHMEQEAGPAGLVQAPLHVLTRSVVPDASEPKLSRDRSRYERIRAEKRRAGNPKPASHLRFPWERVR